MKPGDLVQYSENITGLQGFVGIIVDYNSDVNAVDGGVVAVDVRWFDRGHRESQVELTEFLEVISEGR